MAKRFKVKDLMIDINSNIVNVTQTCLYPTACNPCTYQISYCLCTNRPTITGCGYPSICDWRTQITCPTISDPCGPLTGGGCGVNYSTCPGASVTDWQTGTTIIQTGTIVQTGNIAAQPADLGVLKEQLRAQLAQVEKMEAAQAEALQPQSIEELDELEAKLDEAMQALKARRAELE